jgi:hypothetical protein
MYPLIIVISLFFISFIKPNPPIRKHNKFTLIDYDNDSYQSIEIPITITSWDLSIIQLCLGTPPKCYPFKLATNFNEIFIIDTSLNPDSYNPLLSSTFSGSKNVITFSYSKSNYVATTVKDVLSIPNTSIELRNFPFYLVTKGFISAPGYVGVIGLGYLQSNSEYSFISNLFKHNYISNKAFSLKYNVYSGTLRIGNLAYQNDIQYKSTSMTIQHKTELYYEVALDGIIYQSKDNMIQVFNKPQKVSFSPGSNRIFCPPGFYKFLTKNVFTSLLKVDDICELRYLESSYPSVKCKDAILSKHLGELKFIFGKWSINYSIINLFYTCETDYVCIHFVEIDEPDDKWILGYPFLKRLETIFDIDKLKLSLKLK